jgi:hypothetical protein
VGTVGAVSKLGTVGTAVLPASVDEGSVLAPEAPFRVAPFRAAKKGERTDERKVRFGELCAEDQRRVGKERGKREQGKFSVQHNG